jgi:hypothetical protein
LTAHEERAHDFRAEIGQPNKRSEPALIHSEASDLTFGRRSRGCTNIPLAAGGAQEDEAVQVWEHEAA